MSAACPDCGDSGEVWLCANDGPAGCSHTRDTALPCHCAIEEK